MKYDPINRRQFLGTTATGSALFASGLFSRRLFASENGQLAKPPPVKVYTIFAGQTGVGYLQRPTEELAEFNQYFNDLEKKLGDVRFVGRDSIPPADVGQLVERVKEADAVLMLHMSGTGNEALSKIVQVGKPTALFSEPYSGHDWMYLPELRKQGKKVMLLPSSDRSEIERAVTLMRVPALLKKTRIIAWGPPQGTSAACSAELIKERFGAEVIPYTEAQVKDLWRSIDPAAAAAEAEEYLAPLCQKNSRAQPGKDHRGGQVVSGGEAIDGSGAGPSHRELPLHGRSARVPDVQQTERPRVRRRVRGRHGLDADDAVVRLCLPGAGLHLGPGGGYRQECVAALSLHFGDQDGRADGPPPALRNPQPMRQQSRGVPPGRASRGAGRDLRQTGESRYAAGAPGKNPRRPAPTRWPAAPSLPRACPTPGSCSSTTARA